MNQKCCAPLRADSGLQFSSGRAVSAQPSPVMAALRRCYARFLHALCVVLSRSDVWYNNIADHHHWRVRGFSGFSVEGGTLFRSAIFRFVCLFMCCVYCYIMLLFFFLIMISMSFLGVGVFLWCCGQFFFSRMNESIRDFLKRVAFVPFLCCCCYRLCFSNREFFRGKSEYAKIFYSVKWL